MTIAAILCALLFVALVIGLGVGIGLLRVQKMRGQTLKQGTELGFSLLVPPAGKRVMWVGGDWKGRPAGLSHPALPSRSFEGLRQRNVTEWLPGTRIAVGVRKDFGAIKVYRTYNRGLAGPSEPFEEAFSVREGDEALSEGARQALVAFVQEHGGLRLQDRSSLHPLPYAEAVLDGVPAVLVNDTLGSLDVDTIRARLDALAELARVLEAR